MAQHGIDPEGQPYAPASLDRKPDVGAEGFFAVDMRVGRVLAVEPFPEARKPAWKLTVDFGPVVGELHTSAQITNPPPDPALPPCMAAPSSPLQSWASQTNCRTGSSSVP